MRGKAPGSPPDVPEKGITPACAGKSNIVSRFQRRTQDHPRVCGEKRSAEYEKPLKMGSPPHVRGKGIRRINSCDYARITPACAGKSFVPV